LTRQPIGSVHAPPAAGPLALALLLFVFVLDLAWSLIASSTAPAEFGAVDEPAHLTACMLFLLAVLALVRFRRPSLSFVAAALVASVAIDLDHIPGMLGWHGLSGDLPRPYTHSLITPVALIVVGQIARGRIRPIAFGAAFGVCAHLVRDLCTGPGLSILWPLSSTTVKLPYLVFAVGLVLTTAAIIAPTLRGRSSSGRLEKRRQAPPISRLLPGVLAATISVVLTLSPARAAAESIAVGAYVPGADRNPSLIDSFARQVGRPPVVISSYKRWRLRPFVRTDLQAISRREAVPLITWEPWTLAGRGFSLRAIAGGRYDSYARQAAKQAAAWKRPILLRFAQEMNGDWFPWGTNGNTPHIYKAAWRHLVRIFRSAGADNVEWVWTPNVDGGDQYPFGGFFPGNRWVDWVGLDGFNWARRGEWQSFTELFGSSYETLARITSRPMLIAETGSSQSGGDKAAWVSSALRQELPRFSRIRAVVWFSDPVAGVDFRVNSSPTSRQAFRSAISSPRYGLTRSALLSTPANLRHGSAAPPSPSGDYGQPSLLYRLTQKLHGRYLLIAAASFAAFLLFLVLLIKFLWKRRRATEAKSPGPPGAGEAGAPSGRRQHG
jgi:membrane-bound metal-dependent hydrolase YbcI (DUF457 family)